MLKYLRHSDIAVRININPFIWCWKPFYAHDKPTPFFIKRHTFAIGWLFFQLFIDVDNGETDFKNYRSAFFNALDDIEMKEEDDFTGKVGPKVP